MPMVQSIVKTSQRFRALAASRDQKIQLLEQENEEMKELIEVMKEEMQGINYKIQMDSEELKLAREQTLALRKVIN